MIVAFREVAEAELEAASDVYSALNPELGRRFLAEVDLAVSLAAENPKAYAIVDADIRHGFGAFRTHCTSASFATFLSSSPCSIRRGIRPVC